MKFHHGYLKGSVEGDIMKWKVGSALEDGELGVASRKSQIPGM
ncbi:hypothetical protein T09_1796 [Trichinella sp. T9]|nr:hypothetical protein T09_1796 [Trichinella sp. T9]